MAIKAPKSDKQASSTATAKGFSSPTAARVVHDIGNALNVAATVIPIGRAAKVGAEVLAAKAGAKTAQKIGEKVAQRVAESTPAGKYGSAGGVSKTVRSEGKASVSSKSGSAATSTDSKSVSYTTPKNSPEKRAGIQQAGDTKRAKAVENARASATSAAQKVVGKTIVKTGAAAGAVGAAAGYAAGHAEGKSDAKKAPNPTSNSNPVRPLGNSTPKVHSDNAARKVK